MFWIFFWNHTSLLCKIWSFFAHGIIVVDIKDKERREKIEKKGIMCNQSFGPRHLKGCFVVSTFNWANHSLTVNCQLAAMSCQMCILESSRGLLTLDLALIGWLRKFHKRIEPFMLFTKPQCEAFLSVHCILWCLSLPFLFHFLQNTRFMWLGGSIRTKVIPELPPGNLLESFVLLKKKKRACVLVNRNVNTKSTE